MQVASWCSWILRYFAALTLWQWVWQVCYWITSQHMRSAYICILIWQFTCAHAFARDLHKPALSRRAMKSKSKWRCSSAKYLEWRNNRFALYPASSQAGRKSIWPPVIISDLRLTGRRNSGGGERQLSFPQKIPPYLRWHPAQLLIKENCRGFQHQEGGLEMPQHKMTIPPNIELAVKYIYLLCTTLYIQSHSAPSSHLWLELPFGLKKWP